MINLQDALTEQQLLYMSICAYVKEQEGSELYDISSSVIIAECINLLIKNGEEITTESIHTMSGKLIAMHILENLSIRGLVEESIEEPGSYKITQDGKDALGN